MSKSGPDSSDTDLASPTRARNRASVSTGGAVTAPFRAARLRFSPSRVFYGWWLVGVSGSVMVISTTPMFHAMGLWFVALESTFGWTRTQLSLAFAFTRVEGGILGPVEGYLTDKLGTRRLVTIGMIIMGIGWLLFSQVESTENVPYLRDWPFHLLPGFMQLVVAPLTFYAVYMLIALGQGLGSWLPLMTMLNNWFNRRRATAMGWSNSTSRLGSLLLIPAIAWAIDPDFDRIGWRVTVAIIGVMILVVGLPLTRLIRNRPEDYGLLPDGDKPDRVHMRARETTTDATSPAPSQPQQADFTVRQALRTRAFWLISIGHGFTSMVLIALMAHLAPLMTDQGYDLQTAAYVITAYTVVSMLFQIVGGFVGDRVPKRLALFVFTWIQASGVFILTFGPPTLPVAFGFALLFGIGFGGRNPLTVSIRGEYFGRKSFGKIMGLSQVPMNVLLLAAPVFAGVMRDTRGDYIIAFGVLAGFNLLGGALLLMAKNPRHEHSDIGQLAARVSSGITRKLKETVVRHANHRP